MPPPAHLINWQILVHEASLYATIAGKPVTYVPLELDVLIQNMVAAGLPQPAAELYASIDSATARGQFETVSSDFEKLTGSKPTAVAEFLAANQEALLPEASRQ